jgi:zinc transporter ZupT
MNLEDANFTHEGVGAGSFTALVVFLAALVTAFTTGLGALPFVFIKSANSACLGLANAVAAGMMIGASITLLAEGWAHSSGDVDFFGLAGGIIFGVCLMVVSKRILEHFDEKQLHEWVENMKGADARKIILVWGAMSLHSFAEGVSIGISFAGSTHLARLVTASLAVHNIPEGFAISVLMVRKGSTASKAALWSVLSSLPQPLMAVPAFLSVAFWASLLPAGLGFAAGAMSFVSLAELLPEARAESRSDFLVFFLMIFSALGMVWVSYL